MCSLMMISDMLSKHVGAVKSGLKKLFKIKDIQLVHLLVVCYSWILCYSVYQPVAYLHTNVLFIFK